MLFYLLPIVDIVVIDYYFHQFLHSWEGVSLSGLVNYFSSTYMSSSFRLVDLLDILLPFLQVVDIRLPFILQEAFQVQSFINLIVQVLSFLIITIGAVVPFKVVLILETLSVAFVIAGFSFIRALDLLNVSSSYLKVFLLLVNLVFYILIYKDLDTIFCSLIRVLVYKNFNFLKLFIRDLNVVL